MKILIYVLMFCLFFSLSLEAQTSNLTSLQERARALFNKSGSSGLGNVNLDSIKQSVMPALQNSGTTSALANTAAKYLGGGTSGLTQSLTQSLQDAQSIYSSSMQLMEIANRLKQSGGTSVSSTDVSNIINTSSSIYTSSSRLIDVVKSNAQMINGLMGAYNKLNPGSTGSIVPSGSSGGIDKMQMLQKLLPYLNK